MPFKGDWGSMGEVQTKIRIFSLAKELGIDSKLLISHCNSAGIPVKSSALAAISPEEKQILLTYLESKNLSGKVAAPVKPLVARPPVSISGNQALRDIAARERARRVEVAEEPVSEPIETLAPVVAEVVAQIEQVPVPAVEPEVQESIALAETQLEPERFEADNEQPAAAIEEIQPEAALPIEVNETRSDAPAALASSPAPRSIAAAPTSPMGARMREMRPVGSAGEAGRFAGKMAGRARPAMPALAEMPTFKAKAPPKDVEQEQKAQKPEIRLTPEQWNATGGGVNSPLASRMLKNAEKQADESKNDKSKAPVKRRPEGGDGVPNKTAFIGAEDGADETPRQRRHRKSHSTEANSEDEDSGGSVRLRGPRMKPKAKPKVPTLKTEAKIESPIYVRTLSEAIGRPAKAIIGAMLRRGSMVSINDVLSDEDAWEIGIELGVELEIVKEKSYEEDLEEIYSAPDPEDTLVTRPPIVTILGHVDHGKTTLLDKLRETNIAAGEAGGITQHIRSYQVAHNGQLITFVDTPGHAAFGEMRARGANVTDIVILVVAVDDSVMPQTMECISHAKASGAPIIVALNKFDLPGAAAKEQRVLTDLASAGVQPHEWGGEVEVIRTSGASGLGLDNLLETILLTAELTEFRANPNREAVGVCLEGFRDEGVGPLAWVIVQNGTLRTGDVVLCGATYGKIRSIYNDRGELVSEAMPSTPVKVAGLMDVPGAGDRLYVLNEIELAREIAADRRAKGRHTLLSGRRKPHTLDDILNAAKKGVSQQLNLILKADAPGSIEALKHEIGKIEHPEVHARIIHDAVGGVNESDVYLASASDAVILAFHVSYDDRTQALAEQEGVEIRRYDVIYEITDHIKSVLEGMLRPEFVRVTTGRAIVLQSFSIAKVGTIAGCRVLNGTIERNHRVAVIRDQKVIGDYGIASLKRHKDDVREVRDGMECGLRLDGFNDIKDGDLLEAFKMDQVKRSID